LFATRGYPAKATILQSGQRTDVLFIVERGSVQLSRETEWGESLVVSKVPGDVFGEDVLLGKGPSPYRATAIEESQLYALERSDLDELCASAPGVLIDIMGGVSRRLHSVSDSFYDQSRRQIDDQLMKHTSLQSRLADFVLTRGGSWQTLLFFATLICAWMYVGQFGLPLLRLNPFDPAPFKMLNLILGILAAITAPVILIVLNRNEERESVEPRSRDRLDDSIQTVRNSLERNGRQVRDRLASAAEITAQGVPEPTQTPGPGGARGAIPIIEAKSGQPGPQDRGQERLIAPGPGP
jgi:hypothetical protein